MLKRNLWKKSSFSFVIILLITCIPLSSFSQTRPTVNTQIIPEKYTPGEQVTVSVSSFNVPLDTANIEWQIDGETVKAGVGIKQIKTLAPESGEIKEILILVTDNDSVVEKTLRLQVETIELYVESVDGYTPVWYQGRSHTGEESVVKIIAIPDSFNAISADSRVYNWSKNNFKDINQSGRGRQAFVTKLSPFTNSEDISVSVGSTGETVTLIPKPTNISLFEYSPLVGTRFEKELTGNLSLIKDDITFEVIPWFFSAANRNSSILSMTWTINGLPTKTQGNRSLLNLRKGSTQKGRATVGVSVKHIDRTLQSNRTSLNIDL